MQGARARAPARRRASAQTLERGAGAKLHAREQALRQREETFRGGSNEQLDERLREARREIDAVIDALKARRDSSIAADAERRAARLVPTGETGAARADARAALDDIGAQAARTIRGSSAVARPSGARRDRRARRPRRWSARSASKASCSRMHDGHAEVDVRGKRMRARVDDLRVLVAGRVRRGAAGAGARQRCELQPRERGLAAELNVIGATSTKRSPRRAVPRRRRWSPSSRTCASFTATAPASCGARSPSSCGRIRSSRISVPRPTNQGGGGVTVVELKE